MPTLDEVCGNWNLRDRGTVYYWVKKYKDEGRHLAVAQLPSPPAPVSTPATAPDSGDNLKDAYKQAAILAAKKGYSLRKAANKVNKKYGTCLSKNINRKRRPCN